MFRDSVQASNLWWGMRRKSQTPSISKQQEMSQEGREVLAQIYTHFRDNKMSLQTLLCPQAIINCILSDTTVVCGWEL